MSYKIGYYNAHSLIATKGLTPEPQAPSRPGEKGLSKPGSVTSERTTPTAAVRPVVAQERGNPSGHAR